MKDDTRANLKPVVWLASRVAIVWAFMVFGAMLATVAGEAPFYFWSAVAAAIFYFVSVRWLERTR